jgi:hypothetical protein
LFPIFIFTNIHCSQYIVPNIHCSHYSLFTTFIVPIFALAD